ncbi:MAG TPA: LysR family transcriptional regulator [Dongiaceae bacterium]
MEIYQLRSFAAVAEMGHLTRAAERLHISQPALSSQIKALEDELGLALFERTPIGMALTSAGRRLLPQAQSVLSAAQTLRHEAGALRGEIAGSIRLGTLADPEFIRLGELLSLTLTKHPLIRIELQHEISGAAFEAVSAGKLDASFYYGEATHPNINRFPLREIAYRIAAPSAWSEKVAAAGWKDIAAMPWIIPPAISTHTQMAAAYFRKHGVQPEKMVEADNEAVVSSLVMSGVGLALMREDQAWEKAARNQICLWRDVRLVTTLQFIYLCERETDPLINALLRLLKDIWASSPKKAGNGG